VSVWMCEHEWQQRSSDHHYNRTAANGLFHFPSRLAGQNPVTNSFWRLLTHRPNRPILNLGLENLDLTPVSRLVRVK
jgi:hypothetical protein